MAKRLNESSKGKSMRSKKTATAKAKTSRTKTVTAKARATKPAKELSPSEVIMTMTNKDAERYRAIFRSAWSR